MNAQDARTAIPQWTFGTEISQTAMLHLNVRAQRRHQRWAFGIHGGYGPSSWSEGEIPSGGAGSSYFSINHRNWMYQAVTIGPLVRYHFAAGGLSFVELDAFYRVWWFDRKEVSYHNVESLRFSGLRSERQDISAIRLLWGASSAPRPDRSKKRTVIMEGSAGNGLRTRRMEFVTHEGRLDHYDPPVDVTEDRVDRIRFVTPTIHCGMRLLLVPTERVP